MFERAFKEALGKYLALDKQHMRIDFLQGELRFHNIALHRNALSNLGLPFEVHAGVVERAEVRIPWKSLRSESTVVILDHVVVLVGPMSSAPWDQEAEDERANMRKQKELAKMEKEAEAGGSAGASQSSTTASFFARLVARVVQNLQARGTPPPPPRAPARTPRAPPRAGALDQYYVAVRR